MDDEHKLSMVICLKCYKRWISVRPVGTLLIDIECPNCLLPGFVIETGEELYDGPVYHEYQPPIQ